MKIFFFWLYELNWDSESMSTSLLQYFSYSDQIKIFYNNMLKNNIFCLYFHRYFIRLFCINETKMYWNIILEERNPINSFFWKIERKVK